MASNTTKLLKITLKNIGCIGNEGLEIDIDNILCLVGANNTGKSTVLRAYELAMGTEEFKPSDRCQRCGDGASEIELWVHIPDGIENVGEKWKQQIGDYKILRVRWSWDSELNKTRASWDTEIGGYSEDEVVSGFESVLRSRLPYPFRVGALENPAEEHKKLLTLILQPIADKLKIGLKDKESALSKALGDFKNQAQIPVHEENKKILEIQDEMTKTHSEIFPDLEIQLDIKLEDIAFDPLKALIGNSGVKVIDHGDVTEWSQQGTGSQRALFWTMLQVRSRLKSEGDLIEKKKKDITVLEKSIKKLEAEAEKAKTPASKSKKLEEVAVEKDKLTTLRELDIEAALAALPGYMLIIDEPEIALHPNAIRAASNYLYKLAEDESWQVMMTTHSPAFVNPLEDHTTIVRLERDDVKVTPRTFRSDEIKFSTNLVTNLKERESLKMLNRFDTTLAEMFFGQYPILVEGDTEYTVFQAVMSGNPMFPISTKPVIVRARGKHTLVLIMKMMRHFKIPFSVIHDADHPKNKRGAKSAAWSANEAIYQEIQECRSQGLKVIHRVSIPNIELMYFPGEKVADLEKPWQLWKKLEDSAFSKKMEELIAELLSSNVESIENQDDINKLEKVVVAWFAANKTG